MTNNNQQAFFALVRAGLWEKEVRLLPSGEVDYAEVMRLAQEQAVVGLVAAGLEQVVDVKIPQVWALQFAGQTIQIEQRNKAMNLFIIDLVAKLRGADIYTLLLKGQGIAQCYERPQWRSSGDVDLLLSEEDFYRAKSFLLPLSNGNKPECSYSKELGYYIDSWSVELHGTQRTGLSSRVDAEIDAVQKDLLSEGDVCSWQNGDTIVFLPGVDNDVFLVFTHFIKHFYKEGGVTLRQLCDWCRLLWTYRDKIDVTKLEQRLNKSGLMNEWKAFVSVAVDYLGMPDEATPLYIKDKKWSRKAVKIIKFILEGGEWHRFRDTFKVGIIFPLSTIRFLPGIVLNVNWLKVRERLFKS